MTNRELADFIRRCRHAVQASVARDGGPQAAVVGVATTDDLEIVFDTLGTTRKAENLRRERRIALALWDGACTLQLEGVADEPTQDELARLQAVYFEAFPDGRERQGWPGITYFRVRPAWIRYSDFSGPEPRIFERRAREG
jgi:pyridoxine/pyridoxamine 5'-phosphate oxidase